MRCERDAFDTLFDHAPDKLQVRSALFKPKLNDLNSIFYKLLSSNQMITFDCAVIITFFSSLILCLLFEEQNFSPLSKIKVLRCSYAFSYNSIKLFLPHFDELYSCYVILLYFDIYL